MPFRPQLKPYLRYEIISPEEVLLLSERGLFLLRGVVYPRLVPLLDGQSTVEELIQTLQGVIPPAEVFYTLGLLHRNGYIADPVPDLSAEQATFWKLLGVEPAQALMRLQEVSVNVVACSGISSVSLHDRLSSIGLQVSDNGKFLLVLTDDYLHNQLEAYNQEALRQKQPWMLVKPVGAELWIGPLFLPGETGCWACLAHRIRGSRKIDYFLREKKNIHQVPLFPLATLPSTFDTACNIAATEIAKWIVCGKNEEIEGRILSLDVLSLTKSSHLLTRRPQCQSCGTPSLVATTQLEPLTLHSRRAVFTVDGGHRVFSPEETLVGLTPHISPVTGIVKSLQSHPGAATDHSVALPYAATHNFIHTTHLDSLDWNFLQESLHSASGGKGKKAIQAQVSALSEAIERYSGIFQGDEARIRAPMKDLESTAIHPNWCMLFSKRQLIDNQDQNATDFQNDWVPTLFDEEEEVEWSPGWSLTHNERRWLPTAYCYYEYSRKHKVKFARADSNGCAAGCTKEEAILQGFLELVERDSVALWWYNRLQKPCVDLTSFQDSYYRDLQDYYKILNRDLWVLDITSDLDIPTFAAISRDYSSDSEGIIFGFGTHLDPHLALLRALTEVNQSLSSVRYDLSDGSHRAHNQSRVWLKTATLQNHSYLTSSQDLATKTQADYTPYCTDDLSIEILTCMQIAKAKGLETVVVDQTRPDASLHVVKVIVPGLRHFWPRFAPGRLYDVPVHMGWLAKSLTEDQLNPQPFFF